MELKSDQWWQELIKQGGIETAFQVLLQEFHKHESLEQPSPNKIVPTIATNSTIDSRT